MKVIVIGGGPAGMVASIIAAKNGNAVTLVEHNDKLGRKLLATGNGRCNLTNEILAKEPWEKYSEFYPEDSNGDRKALVKSVMSKFGYTETIEFFKSLGLITRNNSGLIYPYSEQAQAVLDVLLFKLRDLRVNVFSGTEVQDIEFLGKKAGFSIKTNKQTFKGDKVILATGSMAQPKLGSDGSGYEMLKRLGHKINEVRPGLVQLIGKGKYFKSVSGTRLKAHLSLKDEGLSIYEESGQLQFTDYGLSGIVVMNLSNRLRLCKGKKSIACDFMEDLEQESLKNIFVNKIRSNNDRPSGELMIGILPKKLGDVLLKESGIGYDRKYSDIKDSDINRLVSLIKNFEVEITGTKTMNEAQISLGGLDVLELNKNLESKVVPGLFVAGEVLDIHGDCGGFNLQLAFSFGAVAGMLENGGEDDN